MKYDKDGCFHSAADNWRRQQGIVGNETVGCEEEGPKIHSLRVGWRNLVRVSLIFAIIVSFMLFTVLFPLVYVLYFEEFLIHDSRGFMILKKS